MSDCFHNCLQISAWHGFRIGIPFLHFFILLRFYLFHENLQSKKKKMFSISETEGILSIFSLILMIYLHLKKKKIHTTLSFGLFSGISWTVVWCSCFKWSDWFCFCNIIRKCLSLSSWHRRSIISRLISLMSSKSADIPSSDDSANQVIFINSLRTNEMKFLWLHYFPFQSCPYYQYIEEKSNSHYKKKLT